MKAGVRQEAPSPIQNHEQVVAKQGRLAAADAELRLVPVHQRNRLQHFADQPSVIDLARRLRAHDAEAVAPFRRKQSVAVRPAPIQHRYSGTPLHQTNDITWRNDTRRCRSGRLRSWPTELLSRAPPVTMPAQRPTTFSCSLSSRRSSQIRQRSGSISDRTASFAVRTFTIARSCTPWTRARV